MPEHVGLFIPLPERLARQYPPEGKEGEDSSPPHLTLVYIGDVPDDRIDELRSVLARIVQAIPPLELKLLPPTTFENKDGQTIVHSPVSGPLLKKAHDAIDTALKRRGFDVQGYDEFKPHVTIEYVDEGEQPRFDYVRPTGQWIADSVGFWVGDDRRSLPFGRRRIHAAAPWYHGSPNRFDEFKQDKWLAFDRKTVKRPVWLTHDKRFAKLQAGANGCIYTVEYQPRKTFPETDLLEMRGRYLQPTKLGAVVEAAIYDGSIDLGVGPEEDALDILKAMNRLDYDVMETAAVINWARRNRYDSIRVQGDGPENLMVLDAKAVKIVARECGAQAAVHAARRDVIACLLRARRPDLANVVAAMDPAAQALVNELERLGKTAVDMVAKRKPPDIGAHFRIEDATLTFYSDHWNGTNKDTKERLIDLKYEIGNALKSKTRRRVLEVKKRGKKLWTHGVGSFGAQQFVDGYICAVQFLLEPEEKELLSDIVLRGGGRALKKISYKAVATPPPHWKDQEPESQDVLFAFMGNTFNNRALLKKMKARWNPNDKAWLADDAKAKKILSALDEAGVEYEVDGKDVWLK